jgi:exodeoxyribonuclease-1
MNSYLFYDLETSGLNKAFDQVLRFAAIRTDMLFNEIDRHNLSIRLRPDIIISPDAMIVNRLSISDSKEGICEYEAIVKIHRLLNTAGTISLGYNTMRFDDEFLRFSFHRNLLSPYTHQWDRGCHRMDLLPITTVYRLYKQEILNWPVHEQKTSLKLEDLNNENQFTKGPAHNAMADVEACLELARRFSAEEEMWNYLIGYFNKETDGLRIEKLPIVFTSHNCNHRMGLIVDNGFGAELNYQVPVIYIGDSIPYTNQTLWLRLDLQELQLATPETIEKTTWVVRKKFGEPDIILPPHDRYWKTLGYERLSVVEKNREWIKAHPDVFKQIMDYHCHYTYPVIPDLDPEAALYEMGFLSRKEQELCRQFHLLPLSEKAVFIDKFPTLAIRTLAERILCRNYSQNLPKKMIKNYQNYLSRVNPKREEEALLDFKGEKRKTPLSALSDIMRLKKEMKLDDHQLRLIDELEDYLKRTFLW